MSVIEKTAGELEVGDVLLNNGAVVEQVVPSHKGTTVYLAVRFEDGYLQTVTVAVELPVPIWIREDS
jgi:hypothetical protein